MDAETVMKQAFKEGQLNGKWSICRQEATARLCDSLVH
jgi:hypothetical protein